MLKIFTELWYLWLFILVGFVFRLFKPRVKGIIGEKTISAFLLRLDSSKYKIINDLMLGTNGKTAQIDHVVVSNFGVFVIETKNYKGRIMGDEYGEQWTQVISKHKERFYNPVRQNHGHIWALRQNLREYQKINYIPIVVFSVKADLKVKTKTKVIYSVNLLKAIREYTVETITDQQKEAIYSKLVDLNIRDRKARRQHIKEINKKKAKMAEQIKSNKCPQCGGKLILRKGKHGSFKGCSNYPNCKFTLNI